YSVHGAPPRTQLGSRHRVGPGPVEIRAAVLLVVGRTHYSPVVFSVLADRPEPEQAVIRAGVAKRLATHRILGHGRQEVGHERAEVGGILAMFEAVPF